MSPANVSMIDPGGEDRIEQTLAGLGLDYEVAVAYANPAAGRGLFRWDRHAFCLRHDGGLAFSLDQFVGDPPGRIPIIRLQMTVHDLLLQRVLDAADPWSGGTSVARHQVFAA